MKPATTFSAQGFSRGRKRSEPEYFEAVDGFDRPTAVDLPVADNAAVDVHALVDSRLPRPGPEFRRQITGVPALLLLSDVIAMTLAYVLSRPSAPLAALYAVLIVVAGAAARSYRPRLALSVLDDAPRMVGTSLVPLGVALAASTIAGDSLHTQRQLLVFGVTFLGFAFVLHTVALAAARRARRRHGGQRTLVVGAGQVGHAIAESLLRHPELGLLPVGFTDKSPRALSHELPIPVLSTDVDELGSTIAEHDVSAVVIAFSGSPESQAINTIIEAHQRGCALFIVPRLYELHQDGPDIDRVRGVPLLRLRPDPTLRASWWLKRGIDVAAASLGLLLLSPLLLGTAVAVLIESGRPVLFWQRRVGVDGRPFRLAKFRSLRPVAESESSVMWNIASDPRLGPVAKFLRRSSLDEVPQLWNIVRGDMSLVGPRPERPVFVERFSTEHERYWARHRVPVGLTGLAQVNGLRGDTSIAERARYDNYYIANWSLWLDVKILALTVREIMKGSGG